MIWDRVAMVFSETKNESIFFNIIITGELITIKGFRRFI